MKPLVASDQQTQAPKPLRDCVLEALESYLHALGDHTPEGDLYEMVTAEVEGPLLEAVLRHVDFNQCRASAILGINRGTLRKKMQKYGVTRC